MSGSRVTITLSPKEAAAVSRVASPANGLASVAAKVREASTK
jgi:hypothetical protein